jgi:hypothetical protein
MQPFSAAMWFGTREAGEHFTFLQRFRTVHVQVSTSVMWQEGAREGQMTWHPLLAYKTPVGYQRSCCARSFLKVVKFTLIIF